MTITTKPRRRLVSLTITEACNLNCTYCYEHRKSAARMDIEVAKANLQYEFTHSPDFDEIEIDLFGGEPTLHQDTIKELVAWVKNQHFAKPFIFFLQTNGTLVHGEFQDWLLQNKCVWVGLSMDGTPETQNRNRSDSYSRIDTAFFVKNYPTQGVRMTVCPESIGNLAKDVIHLHGLGFTKVDASFAFGVKWNPAIAGVLEEQLRLLCDYYLEHPSINACSMLDMNIAGLGKTVEGGKKWCGTGIEMISIGVDGRKYPCHSFQPNTNANPAELGAINLNKGDNFADPECTTCMFERVCPTCYGLNHLSSHNIRQRDKQICFITKARAKAVAYLRANQIEKGISELTPVRMHQTIEAIQALQRE